VTCCPDGQTPQTSVHDPATGKTRTLIERCLARLLDPTDPAETGPDPIGDVRYAIEFLKEHQAQHKDEPFYCYLAFTSPHFYPNSALVDSDLVYTPDGLGHSRGRPLF
jgi:hypothetical protein